MRPWLLREVGGAPYWLLVVAPIVVAVSVTIGIIGALQQHPAAMGAPFSKYTAIPYTAPPTTPPLTLPKNPRLLVFGDSYTQGYAASTPSEGYAHLVGKALGWKTDVQGVGGTGFTYGGPNNLNLDYGTRIKTYVKTSTFDPNVIVVEGSQNDYRSVGTITASVVADVHLLQTAYPRAQIVLFGPAAPQPLQNNLSPIDAADQAAADQLEVPYISPYQEQWITTANTKEYGYTDGAHLNTAGHAYLAKRFLADFRPLFAPRA